MNINADAFTQVCEFSGLAMVLTYIFSVILIHHLKYLARHQKAKKT